MRARECGLIKWTLVLSASAFLWPCQAEGKWKQVESKSGITVYERWVELSDHRLVRERKGEMLIISSVDRVLNTLSDPSKSKLWMENVQQSYLLGSPNNNIWYSYTSFSLPWPFENRDMVAVSRLKHHGERAATIEITSTESKLAPRGNAKRISDYKAVWNIVDKGEGKVFLSFSTISYVPPEFPRIVHDPVVRNVFLRNLMKLKLILSI